MVFGDRKEVIMLFPFQMLNRRGTALVRTASVAVNTDNVTFTFPAHSFAGAWYKGVVLVEIAQEIPAGTTGTLPILFSTNGVTQAVTVAGGDALTAEDIAGVGVYHFYYDRQSNVLQLLN